ncbi:uncharacterized protein LOC124387289 isoform X1 [Silurus meridionalis]|uniref:uncharacterized protein LOC124387289 isoform X1 n=1 Tax=Silurus meridionalis TaxID=175797 RepID=UPI001EEB29E6|nr:uncharacterized protein LOC124387289 isoform X1 [Silurus meridionalis]
MFAEEIMTTTESDRVHVTLKDILGSSSDNNPEAGDEAGNQQNNTSAQAATTHNTEDTVTLSRRTLNISATIIAIIILGLFGGVVITAYRLMEVSEQLYSGLSDISKEFLSLSRKEGIVPEEVWSWIVAAKADMTLNPHSAHYLLKVSNDGKSLYQASFSSPPRVPTDETYLVCICVSSKNLLNTRSYYELKVTQSVPWTLGLRTESLMQIAPLIHILLVAFGPSPQQGVK